MSCYKLKTVEQLCSLVYQHFKKKEGATFTRAHQKEDQMIKFYLKDAFFTVSIAPQSQHHLHFINTNCSLPMKTVILKKVLH